MDEGCWFCLFAFCFYICSWYSLCVDANHRQLVEVSFGDDFITICFLVHGWVSGHPHNATLNADFGDYCSLVEHLNQRSVDEDFEFLLFDSGDLIEGDDLDFLCVF